MRLLKTTGSGSEGWQPQLVDFRGEEYAILSHRWLDNSSDEVLFADIQIIDDGGPLSTNDQDGGRRQAKYYTNPAYSGRPVHCIPGFDKLQGAAKLAAREGCSFIWIDTCCIDKSSSAELSEAINSMYKYYHESKACFAYLKDVPDAADGVSTAIGSPFALSGWWKRGWTLQELVAPLHVEFYTKDWQLIGEKKALADAIFAITGIGIDVLTHARILDQVSIARRMSWASARTTTRIEDRAYSLMGIFGVNMPLLYGEGEKAFLRLQEEILKVSDDESIFAWVDPTAQDNDLRGMLATSPAHFSRSSEIVYYQDFEDREPYVMSNRGLSIALRLSRCADGNFAAALQCPVAHTGDGFLAVFLKQVSFDRQQFARVKCSKLGSLQARGKLEAIYVRQRHETHRLDRVLPHHFFTLRRLLLGEADEQYRLVQVECRRTAADRPHSVKTPFPTSHAESWTRGFSQSFQVVRGEGKLTAALLFGSVPDDSRSEQYSHLEKTTTGQVAGLVVVMLGSASMVDVGFDAHEMSQLPPTFEELQAMFKPRAGGLWKELDDFHIKVDYTANIHASTQVFLTDITIARVVRGTPFDCVAEAFSHHIGPMVPLLNNSKLITENKGNRTDRPWLRRVLKGRSGG